MSPASSQAFRNASGRVALVATFTGVNLATNYVLSWLPNVKFMDLLYFVAAYEFGLSIGLPVVILTRVVYTSVNPWGPATSWLVPVLVAGDSIYALAGALARKSNLFENKNNPLSRSILLGLVGLFSAFAFDLVTNFGTGLLVVGGENAAEYFRNAFMFGLITMNFPLPMGIIHEASDFFFFMSLVPSSLALLKRPGLLAYGPLTRLADR